MGCMKLGKIDISELSALPEKHEYETAKYFAKRGFDIKFVKQCYVKGFRNPDFEMDGKVWEMKSPVGSNRRTFEDNLRKAIKQSENIIFDLRRLSPFLEKRGLQILKKRRKIGTIKNLLVITRDGKLLTLKGKFGIIEA